MIKNIHHLIRSLLLLLACMAISPSFADENSRGVALKSGVTQPYIVKKHDTLWDIARYFFENPTLWMKIWERNLYITNPDLIYPGNKIWFDPAAVPTEAKSPALGEKIEADEGEAEPASEKSSAFSRDVHQPESGVSTEIDPSINHTRTMKPGEFNALGGLTTVQPKPRIIVKEVERLEASRDQSVELHEMLRRDFIHYDVSFTPVGYILDSAMRRINYGVNDVVYLRFSTSANPGDEYDIFRKDQPIEDPQNGGSLGVLMLHLGRVQVLSVSNNIYKARVTQAFTEISKGDILVPTENIEVRVVSSVSVFNMHGVVAYMQDEASEVSSDQVIAINLGKKQGLRPGMRFSIYRAGRMIEDRVAGEDLQLPDERIAEIIVLSISTVSAMALVTSSKSPINLGDSVRPAGR